MPCLAYSSPSSRVRLITAPLAALYASAGNRLEEPARPQIDAILMILPDCWATMTFSASRAQKNTPSRSTSSTARQLAVGYSCSSRACGSAIPALLNKMSSPPRTSTTRATIASTWASTVTSQPIAIPCRPRPWTTAAVALADSSSMSAQATSAPASAITSANCLPRPLPAPVTSATLPSSLNRSVGLPTAASLPPDHSSLPVSPPPGSCLGATPGSPDPLANQSRGRSRGTVYHCYSSYARGTEFLMGYYAILDRAPQGRGEGDQRVP